MAKSLSDVFTARAIEPPRMIIYGVPKIGKTTLSAEFPSPIFLQVEEGTPGQLEISTFGRLTTFEEVMDSILALYREAHEFQTVVLDSADAFEPLVWAETCRRNSWSNIDTPGYGKGYLAADDVWRDFLDGMTALRDRGMTIILISHAETATISPPGSEPFSHYRMKMQKRGQALLSEWADVIAFVNYDIYLKKVEAGFNKKATHAEGSGGRSIYLDERPAFLAGNRYGMPAKVPYKPGRGYAALATWLPGQPGGVSESESESDSEAN